VRLGALLGPVGDGRNAKFLAGQAHAFESAGFDSLWSVHAVGRGFMLSDPLIALAVAAAVTERVELGTAVLQLPLYPPVDVAHRAFSLAQVCGGRLILGVGPGSTAKDFEAFGADYAARFRTFRESVASLRELFATGRLDDACLDPWPAVRGGPRIFYGTWGKGVAVAAREFDGWIASALHRSPDEVVAAIAGYRAAGGTRAVVSSILLGAQTDLGALRELLARFAEAGFDDAVVMFQPGAPKPDVVIQLVT